MQIFLAAAHLFHDYTEIGKMQKNAFLKLSGLGDPYLTLLQ